MSALAARVDDGKEGHEKDQRGSIFGPWDTVPCFFGILRGKWLLAVHKTYKRYIDGDAQSVRVEVMWRSREARYHQELYLCKVVSKKVISRSLKLCNLDP